MAPTTPSNGDQPGRRPLQAYNSFPQIDSTTTPTSMPRNRASTLEGASSGAKPEDINHIETMNSHAEPEVFDSTPDVIKTKGDHEGENGAKLPSDFDELPVELISLADTFVNSLLSAKIYPAPPTADGLSILLQDFYVLAATHINTHISMLSSRLHRQSPPSSSASSMSSTASRIQAKTGSIGNKDRPKFSSERKETDQQLLTAEEIVERKAARQLLEQKRLALEDAVERRVCENLYDKIWRHRSTQDEAQDEKLRSKTAALAVVGIGLTDLGVDVGEETSSGGVSSKESEVKAWLKGARQELLKMNSEKSPLAKLQHLRAAHKCIVETLSHFHPSSSADEIMPMLIYTLITSPPSDLNVISNLYYIQRFRCEDKIDGEAAYCLTNLEAAITFLETVDLSRLRADESLAGPPKSASHPSTPRLDPQQTLLPPSTPAPPGLSTPSLSPALISPPSPDLRGSNTRKHDAASSLRPAGPANRRLSELFHPAQALGAAAQDAVLNTADQGFKTIGNSLGESYNFLLGKLKERQETSRVEVVLPKTLEDARKLMSGTPATPTAPTATTTSTGDTNGEGPGSAASSLRGLGLGLEKEAKGEDKPVHPINTRATAAPRDRSADSARKPGTPGAATPAVQVAEGIRLLSSSFNPMSKFAGGIGMMRGFGRGPPAALVVKEEEDADGGVAELTTAFPDLVPILEPREERHGSAVKKVEPPIQRFMEVRDVGELRIGEVEALVRDYRRLAGALRELGAL